MRRKVILLGPLPPPFGGVSIYMSALFGYLKGHGVRMWALLGDRRAGDASVRFVNHRRLGIIPALLREGSGARILDTTHFHLEYPHKILLPIWLALKIMLGFKWHKMILDGSLPARYPGFSRVQRLLFRLGVGAVDEFIVVSEELRRWLRDDIRVEQNVTVIPCLLAIPERTLNVALPAATEKSLAAYLCRSKRVCSIGVFIPSYGFEHVAEAVERIRRETREDIGLVLLDGTFARDEDYRAGVLRGRDWITVLENVPNTDVYQILKRSDVFVRAFGHESYGISRVEAIWCGLPVVATTAGETRGMLTYDDGDHAALMRQLTRALYDPPVEDVRAWAELYRREADENLHALVRALHLEQESSNMDGQDERRSESTG